MSADSQERRIIDFCKTIIRVSYNQRLAILKDINRGQCSIIRQVAYNVLLNEAFDLSPKDRAYLNRHLNSIRELASRRVCGDRKRIILVKKHLLVKRLCSIAVKYLT